MQQRCRTCQRGFEVTEDDLAFYDKVSPVFGGKKELIPPPTLCPECRHRRRLAFYNERRLYERTCDRCAKEMISIHHPQKPLKVYCRDCYFHEFPKEEPHTMDPDMTRSMFDQFRSLYAEIPQKWMIQKLYTENSIYCNAVGNLKDSYLSFMGGKDSQRLFYCTSVRDNCESCFDCYFVRESRFCYECIDATNCYNVRYSMNVENCSDSWFLRDSIGCSNCFASTNLRHKEYYFFNEQLSRQGYEAKMQQISVQIGSHAGFLQLADLAQKEWMRNPVPESRNRQVDSSTGNNLEHCSHVTNLFDCYHCSNGLYSTGIGGSADFMDWDNYGNSSELILECFTVGTSCYRTCFSMFTFNNNADLFYCSDCMECSSLFLCVGLKNKKYCILNRQYSKEEYEEQVPKIIANMREDGEWGEFFDPKLSPFGYNETVAMEYYPLEKEEALGLGFNWSDYVPPPPQVERIVKASQLPDSISQVPDTILDWAIECEVSGKPFRVIKQELKFLREHGLPLPRRHPDVRHLDRMKLRNPRKLFDRACMKCSKPIQTTYAPERPETVYCEECYLKEVY